jgi:TPR repeat protein
MLSHDSGKLERALDMIYHELASAPVRSRPHWLSLAGLCELEIAAGQRPSAGAEKRCKRGFELLAQAANLGDANAAMTLSDMYRHGEPPVAKDPAKSKYWNDRALKMGF